MRFFASILAFLAMPAIAAAQDVTTLHFEHGAAISFDVPKGWTACDSKTLAQLGNPSPTGAMKKSCAEFDSKGDARMIGSADASFLVSFAVADQSVFPSTFLAGRTQQQISQETAALCQSVIHLPPGGAPCTFELSLLAGHQALVGHVSLPNGAFETLRMNIVPVDAGTVILMLLAPSPSAVTKDRMDAIGASVRIQANAK